MVFPSLKMTSTRERERKNERGGLWDEDQCLVPRLRKTFVVGKGSCQRLMKRSGRTLRLLCFLLVVMNKSRAMCTEAVEKYVQLKVTML